ncbi:MAG: NAD-dependent epimerase/dehydratase family protein [bacterium]|nr:NAD-dependent epimerase/dehydratase family protein [bacterium]
MKAFLTGASGFVGGHVLRALEARGREVVCLVRRSSDRRNLAASGAATIEGDLTDPDSYRGALEGCVELYHCAADYRFFAREPREMYRINVDGTKSLFEEALRSGVERVVYTSSVGALGLRTEGTPADEETPVTLDDMVGHYKRSKFLAERVAEESFRSGLPVVIVNPSTPVGEGDLKPTPTGRIIVDFLRRKTPAYVETGLNLVDVRDVAEGHVLAAERGRVGEKYILGHANLSLQEIFGILADLTGLEPPKVKLPHVVPIVFAALDTARARLLGGEPRVALEAARLARHKMFFDSGKAVAELGFRQTPVREALARAVGWFREHGYV